MTLNVRLGFTNRQVRVTLRGKRDSVHARGYIRVNGVTVSGYVYDGACDKTFYPEGQNRALPYTRADAIPSRYREAA